MRYVAHRIFGALDFGENDTIMSRLRLVMLTTTALTLGQLAGYPAHAEDARPAAAVRMAQAGGDAAAKDRTKG
ncbi:MAG: hypothetical protein WBA29_13035, partial [Xanthobacteraceae bacterium]